MDLFKNTYDIVRQIPDGMVSTYGAIAKALGDIRASRAVGRMMNQNPDPDNMPCFKIVYSDGKIGGFGRGIDDKIRRLKDDGINVLNGRIVDFEKVFFDNFKTDYPLRKLRKEQLEIAENVILEDEFNMTRREASIIFAVVTFVLCQPVIFFLGNGVLGEMDFWGTDVCLVAFATIEAILFGWVFGMDRAWTELHTGSDIRIPTIYRFIIRFVTPLMLMTILGIWIWQKWKSQIFLLEARKRRER